MHCRVSGVSDYLADDELRCHPARPRDRRQSELAQARVAAAPQASNRPLLRSRRAARHSRRPIEVARSTCARSSRGSSTARAFTSSSRLYGTTLITGWASLHGYPIGILANTGVLFSAESQKAAQFIQLANQTDTFPCCSSRTSPATWSASSTSRAGIIKHGAKMINAVSNSTVPHLTLQDRRLVRRRATTACAATPIEPRFVFIWPNAIAVMGPQQLAGVMSIVAGRPRPRAGAAVRRGRRTRRCATSKTRSKRSRWPPSPRPGLRRRHHRPPRLAHRAGHRAVGRAHCAGTRNRALRSVPPVNCVPRPRRPLLLARWRSLARICTGAP